MAENGFESLDAPLSKSALLPPTPDGQAPVVMEFRKLVGSDGQYILFWGGTQKRNGSLESWTWQAWNLNDPDHQTDELTGVAPDKVERLLTPLAHAGRIRIMQALYASPKTSGQLTEAVGIRGGNLHYHLKELMYASLVEEREGRYALSCIGCQLLLTVSLVAEKVIE